MGFFKSVKKMFSGKDERQAQQQAEQQAAAATAAQANLQAAIQRQQQIQSEAQTLALRDFQGKIAEQTALLAKSQEDAAAARKSAEEANYRASLGPGDSEDARTASEKVLRRLLLRKGTMAGLQGGPMGGASVASKTLTGA